MCQQIDYREHYFFYCHDTKYFWNQVEKWFCNLFSISVNQIVLEFFLGVVNFYMQYYHAANYVILFGQIFHTLVQNETKLLVFYKFQYIFRCTLNIDEEVCLPYDKLEIFEKIFGILLDYL